MTIKGKKNGKGSGGKKIASGIFEYKKGDWREIKPGSTYNQEYLRRIRNGIPVKTAKNKSKKKNT